MRQGGVTGLAVSDDGFEVLAGGERVGSRRAVGLSDVELLSGLAARYARAVQARSDLGAFIGLGRELHGWLEGHEGQLSGLLDRAPRPLVFEVAGIAAANWGLARIDLARHDEQAAMPRLTEAFHILSHLERPDGITAVGIALARLLIATGQTSRGRQVLSHSLAAATTISWTDAIRQINKIFAALPPEIED
jgi:hypothetical protein